MERTGDKVEESSKTLLFNYYVEQARHTEKLRLEFTKFFSGLVSAIAVGGAFLLQNAGTEYRRVVLTIIAAAGCIFCLLAAATLWNYQRLILEWVDAKNALEIEYLEGPDGAQLNRLREVRRDPIYKPVVLRFIAVLPFLVMALLFLFLLLFPDILKFK
jgi:hypothetical protein